MFVLRKEVVIIRNNHKSSFIDKLANKYKTIDIIILFIRCNKALMKIIFTFITLIVLTSIFLLSLMLLGNGIKLYSFGVCVVWFIIIICSIWKKPKSKSNGQPTELLYRDEQEKRRRSDYGNQLYYGSKIYNYHSDSKKDKRSHKGILIFLAIIVSLYFYIILGGTIKVQSIYDNVQKYTVSTGTPVHFIEKSFADHFMSMVTQFSLSWHYIMSDEEVIYTELMIEYGRAAGLETRELEEYLAMYELLN